MDDKRRKYKSMRKNIFLWIFLFIILSTYNLTEKKNNDLGFFSIKQIEIVGIKNSNRIDIEKKLYKLREKNLIFLKSKDFTEDIKDINFINSLKVKKLYPNKVLITIIEDKPLGIYSREDGEKYLLLENNKIIKNYSNEFDDLPAVYGEGAAEKFFAFYLNLKKTGLNLDMVKRYSYYDINRWDLLLIDKKLIRLPSKNYEESILKFLKIYKKSNFEKFKVFDFRIKNELIIK